MTWLTEVKCSLPFLHLRPKSLPEVEDLICTVCNCGGSFIFHSVLFTDMFSFNIFNIVTSAITTRVTGVQLESLMFTRDYLDWSPIPPSPGFLSWSPNTLGRWHDHLGSWHYCSYISIQSYWCKLLKLILVNQCVVCSYDISDASSVSVWPRYQFSYWDSRECHLNPCWNNGASGSRFLKERGLFPGAAREDRMVLDAIWRPQNKIENYRRKFFFRRRINQPLKQRINPAFLAFLKRLRLWWQM